MRLGYGLLSAAVWVTAGIYGLSARADGVQAMGGAASASGTSSERLLVGDEGKKLSLDELKVKYGGLSIVGAGLPPAPNPMMNRALFPQTQSLQYFPPQMPQQMPSAQATPAPQPASLLQPVVVQPLPSLPSISSPQQPAPQPLSP